MEVVDAKELSKLQVSPLEILAPDICRSLTAAMEFVDMLTQGISVTNSQQYTNFEPLGRIGLAERSRTFERLALATLQGMRGHRISSAFGQIQEQCRAKLRGLGIGTSLIGSLAGYRHSDIASVRLAAGTHICVRRRYGHIRHKPTAEAICIHQK
jgi:hypothetical protein